MKKILATALLANLLINSVTGEENMGSFAKAFAVPKHEVAPGKFEEIRYNEEGWPLTKVVSGENYENSFPYIPVTSSGLTARDALNRQRELEPKVPKIPNRFEQIPIPTETLDLYKQKLAEGDARRIEKAKQFGTDPSSYPLSAEETKMKKALERPVTSRERPEYQQERENYQNSVKARDDYNARLKRENAIQRNKETERMELEKEGRELARKSR